MSVVTISAGVAQISISLSEDILDVGRRYLAVPYEGPPYFLSDARDRADYVLVRDADYIIDLWASPPKFVKSPMSVPSEVKCEPPR